MLQQELLWLDDDFPSTEADESVAIKALKSTVSETEIAPFQVIAKTKSLTARTIRVMVENKGSGDFLPARYNDP